MSRRKSSVRAPFPRPDDTGKSPDEIWEELCSLCRDYLYPPGMPVVHKVLARLATYAKYGPGVRLDDGKVGLRGGARLLQRHEEKQLLDEEEKALLAEVYNYSSSQSNPNIVPRDLAVTLNKSSTLSGSLKDQIHPHSTSTTMTVHSDRPARSGQHCGPEHNMHSHVGRATRRNAAPQESTDARAR